MKPQRIRVYLITLVAACGFGGVVLFGGMYQVDKFHERVTHCVTLDQLALQDLERFDALFKQWILLSDLTIGSDETYVTPGAQELGAGLTELCEEIAVSRIAVNHETPISVLRQFVKRQNERLDATTELPLEERAQRLDAMLYDMDEESIPAFDAIDELRIRGNQQLRWDRLDLADMNSWRGFFRGIMLSSFLVYVAVLWRWSSRKLSRPVTALSSEARSALRENRRMVIKQAGPVEVRQLTRSMSQLVGSLENQVEERTQHLEKALKESEAAVQAKSDFLANMSHEIRTPMTAVIGFSERLRDEQEIVDDPEKRSEAIEAIVQNGHHLLSVINSILDLSRIESGKLELELIDVCPFQQATDAVSALQVKADEQGLDLKLEFSGNIPTVIQSDPTRLQQILINLIGNAIKFTPAGHVKITLSVDEDKQRLLFAIEDSGIGIEPEAMERLFKPFEQADSSMSRRFGGTGLGLSLSQNFAMLLGGDIVCESEFEAGSTFTLSHPCEIESERLTFADWKQKAEDAAAATTRLKQADDPEPLKELNILLVEDNAMNQILVESLLSGAGAAVTLASDGQQGFNAATAAESEGSAYDVILMDMQMPIMDGYTATAKLRETDYTGVIIALTGHAMAHDRQKCLDAGCNDYSTKPIDRDLLFKTIDRCLEERDGVDAKSQAPAGV